MEINIQERDIDSKLCGSCGACCRITFRLTDTNSRYRRFLRQIGYTLTPPPEPGKLDCCDKKHDITVDMGYCKHLDVRQKGEETSFRCTIYGTKEFPELCAQFNCAGWAKAHDSYSTSNGMLVQAQTALDRPRSAR